MSGAHERGWCLVTGASRGIGEAIAAAALEAGFGVVGWSRSRPLAAVPLNEADHSPFVWQHVDVGDVASVRGAFADLEASGIKLSAVVLNAGSGRWRALEDISNEEWRSTLSTNLDGSFHVLKGALRMLDLEAGPIIVGLLSDSALHPFAERAAYSASKAGMKSLIEGVRLEMRDSGVRFSLVYPSRVDTHFAGSHAQGAPGLRPGSLTPAQVADTVRHALTQPKSVEIREIHLCALGQSFGPYHSKASR